MMEEIGRSKECWTATDVLDIADENVSITDKVWVISEADLISEKQAADLIAILLEKYIEGVNKCIKASCDSKTKGLFDTIMTESGFHLVITKLKHHIMRGKLDDGHRVDLIVVESKLELFEEIISGDALKCMTIDTCINRELLDTAIQSLRTILNAIGSQININSITSREDCMFSILNILVDRISGISHIGLKVNIEDIIRQHLLSTGEMENAQ